MFTGLIQTLGNIVYYDGSQLLIRCSDIASQIKEGDSVAVNGVCLTAAQVSSLDFKADVSPETLKRSNLSNATDLPVNLELALQVGDRLGGHFVTGHIDGIGHFCESSIQGDSWLLSFSVPESIGRYVISKGSVAINGVSLTVADCNSEGTWFSVAVIPHTYTSTNLQYLVKDNSVNLEADLLGKYVEKFMRSPSIPSSISKYNSQIKNIKSDISPDFLIEHGWI
jgi:riboflavin synthase